MKSKLAIILGVAVIIIVSVGFIFIHNKSGYSTSQGTSTQATQSKDVTLYFNNFEKDPAGDCANVFAVTRKKVAPATPETTLTLLFSGPTDQEKQNGFSSMFSLETKDLLKDFFVKDSIAYVDLHDERSIISGAGSSCGGTAFMSAIEKTLGQFGHFDKVIYAINGNPTLFYEWNQLGCSDDNNFCDDSPFRARGK